MGMGMGMGIRKASTFPSVMGNANKAELTPLNTSGASKSDAVSSAPTGTPEIKKKTTGFLKQAISTLSDKKNEAKVILKNSSIGQSVNSNIKALKDTTVAKAITSVGNSIAAVKESKPETVSGKMTKGIVSAGSFVGNAVVSAPRTLLVGHMEDTTQAVKVDYRTTKWCALDEGAVTAKIDLKESQITQLKQECLDIATEMGAKSPTEALETLRKDMKDTNKTPVERQTARDAKHVLKSNLSTIKTLDSVVTR